VHRLTCALDEGQYLPLNRRLYSFAKANITVRITTRAEWSGDQMPAGRVEFPCPSILLSNRYLVFSWGKSAGEWCLPPPSTAGMGCRYISAYHVDCRGTSWGSGALTFIFCAEKWVKLTVWMLYCPCQDLNPVSSVLQPVDFSLHSLSYNGSITQVSTQCPYIFCLLR
jgi:hypothetical protein